jgi:hypothetical protein
MNQMFEDWPCDEIANRFPGMTTPLYRKLHTFAKEEGNLPISHYWDRFTEDEQIWLNDIAECYHEPN